MIISILNAKGGAGKSTIAINLSYFFSNIDNSKKTLLIDTDPQKSINVWQQLRNGTKTNFNIIFKNNINFISEAKKIFDFIIIDTSGSDTQNNRNIMEHSDIVIIPTHVSMFDVAVLNGMIDFFHAIRKNVNKNMRGYIVINRVSANPKVKYVEKLREFMQNKKFVGIKLLHSVIYDRIAYQQSIGQGKSIFEFCKATDKALTDFRLFCEEILVSEVSNEK